jgi:hypothetical protein
MPDDSPKILPPSSDENSKKNPQNSNEPICRYGKDFKETRGALKLEASTSTPLTSAGNEISIYVVIRNPFPVPVVIYSTETHIPVEITDELGRKREKRRI